VGRGEEERGERSISHKYVMGARGKNGRLGDGDYIREEGDCIFGSFFGEVLR